MFTINVDCTLGFHRYRLVANIIAEPIAWAKKYFTAPSVSWFVLVAHIRGIKLNRLISIAAHAMIQFVLDTAIKVLNTIVVVARKVVGVQ